MVRATVELQRQERSKDDGDGSHEMSAKKQNKPPMQVETAADSARGLRNALTGRLVFDDVGGTGPGHTTTHDSLLQLRLEHGCDG